MLFHSPSSTLLLHFSRTVSHYHNPFALGCKQKKTALRKLQRGVSLAKCCIRVPLFRELVREFWVFMTFWLWRNFFTLFLSFEKESEKMGKMSEKLRHMQKVMK
jgi:hypothetical protein